MNDISEMNRLTEAVESRSMLDAVAEVFGTGDEHVELLHQLFTAGTENWRMLVSDHVRGDCLDVYAGYGKRSLLLGELAERVYAVDPTRERLRFLSQRNDYESHSAVIPVRADVSSLPFSPRSFETIVASESIFAREKTQEPIRHTVRELRRYLTGDGSLLLLVAGWPQLSGLTDLLGIESEYSNRVSPSFRGMERLCESNPRCYRSILESVGFDTVTSYALWPGQRLPEAVFPVESSGVSDWLIRSQRVDKSNTERVGQQFVSVLDRSGLLKYFYPSYLVVCSTGNPSENDEMGNPLTSDKYDQLLIRGRSRSVLFDRYEGDIRSVKKIPNRKRHAPFIRQEHDTVQTLRSSEASITETLPAGTIARSRFGPVYVEQPATGAPLTERMEQSVESFRIALEVGLNWLREFQQTFRGERVTVSPEEVRDDLSFERLGLSPPPISDPVTMYTTPCHGDLLPRNIYVKNGEVSEVIDWEYGALSSYHVTDLAYYVIRVAAATMGDLKRGIESAFLQSTPYSSILRDVVRDYCETVGIPVRSLLLYLGYPWIRREKINYDRAAAVSYTAAPGSIVPYIQLLWNRMNTLERRFL